MRMNQVGIIVGKRGSGKTTFARKLMSASSLKKKLVVDTFDHESYNDIPDMGIEQLQYWKGGSYHLWGSDTQGILDEINRHVRDTLVLFEDATKYIDTNPQPVVKSICLDSKQKNNDIVFMFHSFADVPPKLFRWMNFITVFKTEENFDNQRSRLNVYERLLPVVDQVARHESPWYNITFRLD